MKKMTKISNFGKYGIFYRKSADDELRGPWRDMVFRGHEADEVMAKAKKVLKRPVTLVREVNGSFCS